MSSRFLAGRRRVLQYLATTLSATAITLPTHAAPRPAFVTAGTNLSAAVDRLISHPNSAAIIGEAYLTQFHHERSVDILLSKIRESLQSDSQHIEKDALLDLIRLDFELGNIVNLHGWLLSETEARLCALYTF